MVLHHYTGVQLSNWEIIITRYSLDYIGRFIEVVEQERRFQVLNLCLKIHHLMVLIEYNRSY